MAKQLYGKNYADMSDKYKSKNTKQDFKEARREQRGDIMMNGMPQDNSKSGTYTQDRVYPNQEFSGKTNSASKGGPPSPPNKKGSRKAGEALEANTPVAAEAAESVKEAAVKAKGGKYQKGQQHYSKGNLVDTGAPNKDYPGQDNNPYTVKKIENFDLAAGGAGAKKGTNRLSAQDIKRLRKQGGFSRQEIVDYAENNDFGDGPGASGGKAQALLGKYKDAIKSKQAEEKAPEPVQETTPAPQPTPTPTPTPTPGQTGPVEVEGNDNVTVTGDYEAELGDGAAAVQAGVISGDNSGNVSVDNSRTYGGSYRNFEYNGSGNPATDTPVSAATMGGFYDVDDSPAANAARVDRQSDQNTQLQAKYSDTSGIAQGAIDRAGENAYIDPAALDKRVSASAQNMFDMSTMMGANIFGDMSAYKPPTWNSPKPAEKIKAPDFNVDAYTNF